MVEKVDTVQYCENDGVNNWDPTGHMSSKQKRDALIKAGRYSLNHGSYVWGQPVGFVDLYNYGTDKGKTSWSKFKSDCSGLTRAIYYTAYMKKLSARTAIGQSQMGKYVSFSNMKPGDIMCFKGYLDKPDVVTHVGIYEGVVNNKKYVIHITGSLKKVSRSPLGDNDIWRKLWLKSRNVVGD